LQSDENLFAKLQDEGDFVVVVPQNATIERVDPEVMKEEEAEDDLGLKDELEADVVLARLLDRVDVEKLTELVSMGFGERDSRKALCLTSDSLEEALDMLTNGIPEAEVAKKVQQERMSMVMSQQQDQQGALPSQSFTPLPHTRVGSADERPAFIRMIERHPQFLMMKEGVREGHDEDAQNALVTLGELCPEFASEIADHAADLIALLAGRPLPSSSSSSELDRDLEDSLHKTEESVRSELPSSSSSSSSSSGEGVEVELTEEDWAAIHELEEFGFPQEKVLEAYIMSGKNKEQAIEYLLSG
jgi:hypothetical protein